MEFHTELYEHQVKAVSKLSKVKVGALYMEMGTGKTRTALELIRQRLDAGKVEHAIWLCPCSVKETLRRDIIKHCGELDEKTITICGIETLSSSIREYSRLSHLVHDKKVFLIVDESNLVKNHKTKRAERIIYLSGKCQYKLILNGTPISRNEADLYAQWYVLDWRIFGYKSFWSFAHNHLEYDDYGRIRKTLNVDYLTDKMAPYCYQVKKDECLDLPSKSYSEHYFWLTDEQEDEYERVKELFLSKVDEFEPHTIYRLFTALQLVLSGKRIVGDSEYGMESEQMIAAEDDPRIDALLETLDEIDGKAIIFCKFTDEIKNVSRILQEQYGKGSAIEFYGELNQKQRQANLDKFAGPARFLVANKTCAGYGLNLQFCSHVVFYSNDWDYATRMQAEDRVHRIGQESNVHIVDIIAINKLDERIAKCLRRKERLADRFKEELHEKRDLASWIDGGGSSDKNRLYRKRKAKRSGRIRERSWN